MPSFEKAGPSHRTPVKCISSCGLINPNCTGFITALCWRKSLCVFRDAPLCVKRICKLYDPRWTITSVPMVKFYRRNSAELFCHIEPNTDLVDLIAEIVCSVFKKNAEGKK